MDHVCILISVAVEGMQYWSRIGRAEENSEEAKQKILLSKDRRIL